MRKVFVALAFLGCSFLGGATAQSIGGTAFAVNNIVTAFQVLTQGGTSQSIFNLWGAQFWDLSEGTAGAPVTSAGPLFKVSRTENMASTSCNGNIVDNECNAALAVYSSGAPTSQVQTNAIFAGAKGSPVGTDIVGLTAVGTVTGSGTGIGTGLFALGRRDTATGNAKGGEINVTNNTSTSGTYNSAGFSNTTALWLSTKSQQGSNSGAALGIGWFGAGMGNFVTGVGITSGSVSNVAFSDDSQAVTSIAVNSTHTYGLDLTAGTFSGAPILAPLTTPASSSATCKQGATEWDASFIYICTATNVWKRATLASF